ncbi:hypothetical protein ABH922_005497 [Rhodococcus sp. 27YEA15]|uniref:hypothetical protein n=1 Tax=Rhodococcus sp. 27YEA15 TaxID=3156259 RepID=UPI003C7C450E
MSGARDNALSMRAVDKSFGRKQTLRQYSFDIERGTYVLGRSQFVSRARWYWNRVLVVFVTVTAAATLLGYVLHWARSPIVEPIPPAGGDSPLIFPVFLSTGIVACSFTLLALILGSSAAGCCATRSARWWWCW